MQRLSGGVKHHPETLMCRARVCTDSQFLISDAETATVEAGRRPRQRKDSRRRDGVTETKKRRADGAASVLHASAECSFSQGSKVRAGLGLNAGIIGLCGLLIEMMHVCSVCSHMRFFHSGETNKVRPCDASSALTPAASRDETPHPPGTFPPPSAFPGCSAYLQETFPQTAFCF